MQAIKLCFIKILQCQDLYDDLKWLCVHGYVCAGCSYIIISDVIGLKSIKVTLQL